MAPAPSKATNQVLGETANPAKQTMSPATIGSQRACDRYEDLPAAYAFVNPETRGAVAEHLPRVVFIEVTNRCNLLCKICARTLVSYEKPHTLSWEDFLSVVQQFPDMRRAVLHGIGEPLLNPELPRMIRHLKERGVTVLFNSNATLLDEKWSQELIHSGLDELRCSIDGADPLTYERIRGLPMLGKVVQNLQRFTELQSHLGVSQPKVSIWMTGMRENIGELPDLVRLAAQVKVREVYLQRMVYYLDNASAPGLLKGGRGLFDNFDEQAERLIAEAEELATRLGVTLKSSGATDPRRSLEASRRREARPWAACLRPWSTAYVTANGNCLPCCLSPFSTQDYEGLICGNLFGTGFNEIWNNEKYRHWREMLLSDRPHVACRGCGVHWSL